MPAKVDDLPRQARYTSKETSTRKGGGCCCCCCFTQEIGGQQAAPCYDPDHDHGPGFGTYIWTGYRDIVAKVQVGKTASFFEFSLCLSRACLGKMIVFIYKWLKNAVFRRLTLQLQVRKRTSCAPCYTKNDRCTKTGSGQT
jgi:hypothetical protein